MKVLENESLAKYTTFGVGGIARNFYIPQTESELINLVQDLEKQGKTYLLLGGGSNLLINDQKVFNIVIWLKEFSRKMEIESNIVCVGASLTLPKFITEINKAGLGGIEYLYSVPGTVGGAVYMNAGRGKKYGMCISDYLLSVTVLEEGAIKQYSKDECKFGYRSSIFQNKKIIILSARFAFDRMNPENGNKLQQERIALCRKVQDNSGKNFGTVFCESSMLIMKIIRKLQVGKKGQVQFSPKTLNWIINKGNGSYAETIKIIQRVEKLHHVLGKDIRREVIIWE